MKRVLFYNPEQAGQLHCDACGYDLPEPHPFTPDLIGKPCPKCGANMLTERDYKATARMFRIIDRINRFCALFGIGREEPRPEWEREGVQIKMHNGEMIVKQKEKSS